MRKIFEALFAMIRKFAPFLIAVLVVMLAFWVSTCMGCFADTPEEPTEISVPVVEEDQE